MKLTGFAKRKKKLLTVGVCMRIATTVAVSQRTLRACTSPTSVSGIALLFPGIAIHVIAALLPKAGFVTFGELEAGYPLGRLPEIQMRHQQTGRTAVVGRDGL